MLRRFALSPRLTALFFFLAALSTVGASLGRHHLESNAIAVSDICVRAKTPATHVLPVPERLVAHAGGAVNGTTYTNSREALDLHYSSGYRIFEVDLNWTSDGQLVLVHDWTETSAAFGVMSHVFSSGEFVRSVRHDGLHQMTFEDLRQWLRTHRDALIVTDTKASNPQLLEWLSLNGGDILPQLIVQVYRLTEVDAARRLHPRAVWLTVYRYNYPSWALQRISAVDAFVIPVERYSAYSKAIAGSKVHVYVHSVSTKSVAETFRILPEIYGIFVD